jgi:uncharacterized protein (DUF1499 family)
MSPASNKLDATAGHGTSRIARASRNAGMAAVVLSALGPAGVHLGAVAPIEGFILFVGGAAGAGLTALALGLLGLVRTKNGNDPIGRLRARIGVGIGAPCVAIVLAMVLPGSGLPPINDVTTDVDNPPLFAHGAAQTAGDYPDAFIAQVRNHYADLGPTSMALKPSAALSRARSTAESLGWQLASTPSREGHVDATQTSKWFRFIDDIVVRVTASPSGSIVDVRSRSRDGRRDFGVNAARIRLFLTQLKG